MGTRVDEFNNASLAALTHTYRRLSIKKIYTQGSIFFNNRCLRENLTPVYIKIKINQSNLSARSNRILRNLRNSFLKEEIRKNYQNLHFGDVKLKCIYDILVIKMPFVNLNHYMQSIHSICNNIKKTKYNTLNKKLQALRRQKNVNNENINNNNFNNIYNFYPSLLNFTDITFNLEETELLKKGLKYKPLNNNKKLKIKDLERVTVETESIIQTLGDNDKDNARDLSRQIIKQEIKNIKDEGSSVHNNKSEIKLLNNIRQKIVDNDIVVTKADKGDSMVLLNKIDYNNKILNFITDNNFIQINPKLSSFIIKTKDCLKKCKKLLDKKTIQNLNPDFTIIPRLYGLLKVHKSDILVDMPIRPVVSYNSSPTYKIAKWLNNFINNTINLNFSHTIKNSTILANKIKNIEIPNNSKFISIDVTNLFTNIPISEVKTILKHKLILNNLDNQHIKEIMMLLDICLQQNFFNFNSITYSQPDGLAMGSPLSPLLADLFMDHFETNYILNNNNFKDKIIYYYRYVDDVLMLWNDSLDNAYLFLNHLNSLHNKIKFTMEIENLNKTINFLDLTINNVQNKHSFQIYRKPTHTGLIINNTSQHPISHKHAAFHSHISRLFNIPLNSDNFDKEVTILKHIAFTHNFNPNIIDKLILRKRNKIAIENAYITQQNNRVIQNNKYFSLTFIGHISYKIANIFKQFNYNISFKTNQNLRNILINNKDKIDPINRSGIYKLTCSCSQAYVGRTYRNFKIRKKEHFRHIRLNSNESLFAKHILESGHNFDTEQCFEILHFCDRNLILNNLEVLEILRLMTSNRNFTLNSQLNFESNSLIKVLFQ